MDKIINKLISNGVFKEEDRDIAIYGLKSIFLWVFNSISILILGFIIGMFFETIVFLVSFIPIREYAGGYHARSSKVCYFMSSLTIVLAMLVLKNNLLNDILVVILGIFSSIIILILAPQQDINKPLDYVEKKVYKKRAYIMLLIELIIAIMAFILNKSILTYIIILGLFILSILLILGKFNNIRFKEKNNN